MTSISERKSNLLDRLAELQNLDEGAQDERAIVMLDQQSVGRLNRIEVVPEIRTGR